MSYYSRPLFSLKLKDRLPAFTNSICIYNFTCSCGARYIRRTTRSLSKRIKEDLPSWFGKGLIKSTNSLILAHLIDSGHHINHDEAFNVLHKIPPSTSRFVQSNLLNISKAIAIRLHQPELCIQKKKVRSFSLP